MTMAIIGAYRSDIHGDSRKDHPVAYCPWVVFPLAPLVGLEPTTCGLTVT